jgi:hypothetical protein
MWWRSSTSTKVEHHALLADGVTSRADGDQPGLANDSSQTPIRLRQSSEFGREPSGGVHGPLSDREPHDLTKEYISSHLRAGDEPWFDLMVQ